MHLSFMLCIFVYILYCYDSLSLGANSPGNLFDFSDKAGLTRGEENDF